MINTVIDESKVEASFVERLKNPARDYAKSASAFMWLGWLGLGVCLISMILGFVWINQSRPVLAVENGQVVGTVQYHNRQIRSPEQIARDLKQFMVHYINIDSVTLWEDRRIFFKHLCEKQRNIIIADDRTPKRKDELEDMANSNIRSSVNFNFEKAGIKAVELESYQGDHFRATLRAERVVGLNNLIVDRVQYRVQGRFVQRSETQPLGIELCGIRRVKWSQS